MSSSTHGKKCRPLGLAHQTPYCPYPRYPCLLATLWPWAHTAPWTPVMCMSRSSSLILGCTALRTCSNGRVYSISLPPTFWKLAIVVHDNDIIFITICYEPSYLSLSPTWTVSLWLGREWCLHSRCPRNIY